MRTRLRDETENRSERPRQDPGLPPRQSADGFDPIVESDFHRLHTVKQIEERQREGFCTRGRSNSVSECHFFKREQQIGARFDAYCRRRYFGEFFLLDEIAKCILAELRAPAFMGLPFIIPLPREIGFIAKARRKYFEKFAASSFDACRNY
jgi:hypothetical protein